MPSFNGIRAWLTVRKGEVTVLELSLGIGNPNEKGEKHPDCFLIEPAAEHFDSVMSYFRQPVNCVGVWLLHVKKLVERQRHWAVCVFVHN